MDHSDQTLDHNIRLEQTIGQLAQHDPKAKPWHEALVRLNSFDVDGAAALASQIITNGSDPRLVESVISAIASVAVRNQRYGPGFEAMSMRAADSGYPDHAYNAGNALSDRAASPSDYSLAERYYRQAYTETKDDGVRASSIANCAAITRDGSITGQPDWPGAVELYEKAAALGLVAGMFNAGNVCMWLVDQRQLAYAPRAAEWFKKTIAYVESGKSSVDPGGETDRTAVYESARIRLAEVYARGLVLEGDFDVCKMLLAPYLESSPHARWCYSTAFQKVMGEKKAKPSETAGGNWASVMKMMEWNVLSSTPFDYGKLRGVETKGDLLAIEAELGTSMTLIVMDCFVQTEFESFSVMIDLAYGHYEQLGHPCFIASRKGYFTTVEGNSYSVLFHIDGSEFTSVPIWPGATCAEILALVQLSEAERFVEATPDTENCIPILVNALSEGLELTGDGLPDALWIGAGENLCFPILSSKEPARLGVKVSCSEAELDEKFEAHRQARLARYIA